MDLCSGLSKLKDWEIALFCYYNLSLSLCCQFCKVFLIYILYYFYSKVLDAPISLAADHKLLILYVVKSTVIHIFPIWWDLLAKDANSGSE